LNSLDTRSGDRLRGMKFTLKLAYLSKRVFLIDNTVPEPLEKMLMPSLLDWRPNNITINTTSFASLSMWHDNSVGWWGSTTVDKVIYSSRRYIEVQSNLAHDVKVRNAARPISETPGDFQLKLRPHKVRIEDRRHASCVLRTLFRPHPDLEEAYKAQLQRMFGSESAQYAAIHFRAGGMLDETQALKRIKDSMVVTLMRSLACAKRSMQSYNITTPILLLADNHELRASINSSHFGRYVTTTTYEAVHIDFLKGDKHNNRIMKQQLISIYMDLLLLIGARCLLLPSRSGFSNQAALWGAHECFLGHTSKCFKMPMEESIKTAFHLPGNW
jgi:hypothetical protein